MTINRERIESICRGDGALALELVVALVDEATPLVAALREQAESYQIERVHELAHSLKGIAGSVGAFELRDAAAHLETSSAPQQLPPATELAAEIVAISQALENVRRTCRSWQASRE